MLDTLGTHHRYPGRLIVVEGIDGSGKTTQLGLLHKWLAATGHHLSVTEWNSSALVKAAVKAGKRKNVEIQDELQRQVGAFLDAPAT